MNYSYRSAKASSAADMAHSKKPVGPKIRKRLRVMPAPFRHVSVITAR
jgi:hypothetical protein